MSELSKGEVYGALSQVIDPEIGLDIVTLGLVYEVEIAGGVVDVSFTLTTPGCPMERAIRHGILACLSRLPGVEQVNANLVWDPPWHPGRVAEGAL